MVKFSIILGPTYLLVRHIALIEWKDMFVDAIFHHGAHTTRGRPSQLMELCCACCVARLCTWL